jgi:hypothetical protein
MAKAALSTLERPAGAIPLSEYLQHRPRWKTFLAAKAEYDRLMQPVIVGFLPSDEQKRSALARAEAERKAALAEFHADRQAGKIRLIGRLGHPWEPYRDIPSDAPLIFRFGTSTAVERDLGASIFKICVVPSHLPVASQKTPVAGRRNETQVERAYKFLKDKWPPFGVPPDDLPIKKVQGMLDQQLETDNRNRGLRTPSWDSVKRAIKRAKKAKPADR